MQHIQHKQRVIKIAVKRQAEGHKDDRGMLYWVSPTLLGFEYKEVTVGSIEPGKSRGGHYHKKTQERLMCIAGRLTYISDGEEKAVMEPGDIIEVPIETVHVLANKGQETAYFLEFKNVKFDKNDPDMFRREGKPQ